MAKTIVKKKELQKLIFESLRNGKRVGSNSPKIDFVKLNENVNRVHNRIRINIVKEGVKTLNIRKYTPILSEEWQGMDSGGRNPGVSAANGIEEVLKGLYKAYEFVKDKETGKMIMNSIVRLSNTLTVIGTYVGSGQSQRRVNPDNLYSQLSDIKYPEVEAAEETVAGAERMKKSYVDGY